MTSWLQDYQKISEEIELLQWKLDNNQSELKRWIYGDLQEIRLEKASKSSNLEEIIWLTKEELEFKKKEKEKLESIVNGFKGLENQVLTLKYIDGKTLQEIADELGYTLWHIQRTHAKVMKVIKCQLYANDTIDKS
ncbi:MAG: sigma factor-like helix-turn-helix DNA-binding protein [Carnobacterium sp.]|uniref:sigma factor-like helix-turn-helix DNA-binding protein n=1 Tax=Carnobacterium sp. TaxID=48221 RepID=UPI002FC83246